MDPGFYEDLAGRLNGLLIGLQDRLNCDDASITRQFTGTRQDGLALEEITRTVAHRTISVTDTGRAGIVALAGLAGLLARARQMPLKGDLVREQLAHGQLLLPGARRAAVRPGDQAG
jgi:hypothetical protein